MRFEPFFLVKDGIKGTFYKRDWTYIINLKNEIKSYKEIKGIKFVCDEGDEDWGDENPSSKSERMEKEKVF
ncbi:MAG: hypothetical protein HC831_21090 [Chloroflexia bacterium]|nr:hypothetical protein [Chloroflexia bacterium]